MPTFSKGFEYVNRITGMVSRPFKEVSISNTFVGVVPAARARAAAAWITGPSARGSL